MNIVEEIAHLIDIGYTNKDAIHERLQECGVFVAEEPIWFNEADIADSFQKGFEEGYQEAQEL